MALRNGSARKVARRPVVLLATLPVDHLVRPQSLPSNLCDLVGEVVGEGVGACLRTHFPPVEPRRSDRDATLITGGALVASEPAAAIARGRLISQSLDGMARKGFRLKPY